MKNNKVIHTIAIVLSWVGCFSLGFLSSSKTNSQDEVPDKIQKEIQDLGNRLIDTIKVENTILASKNDSIQIKIVKIKEEHEKTATTILSNDAESDYDFFSDYITKFRLSRPDLDEAIESSEFDIQ